MTAVSNQESHEILTSPSISMTGIESMRCLVKQSFSPEDLEATAKRLNAIELADASEVDLFVRVLVSEAVADNDHTLCKHYAELIAMLLHQMEIRSFPTGADEGIPIKAKFLRALINHIQ
ncbi:unnamed protein product, partial [Polarella glacialis]